MKIVISLSLVAGLLLLPGHPLAASHSAGGFQDDPRDAAESWLGLVDEGDYDASWREAASIFTAQVTQEQWVAQMAQGREPAGTPESREFLSEQSMTDPPGAPPGEYVQIRFRTSFSQAGPATEVVVMVDDGERGWRVAGYFVQP